ncbi:MAG: hypothetical protein E5299_01680 [Burkholderia gladioli]|nr:MAG: hypothetical protein E5299_01680 [Burkholderia gladioli]
MMYEAASYTPQWERYPSRHVANRREGLSVVTTVKNSVQVRWKVFEGAMNADILPSLPEEADQRHAQQESVSDSRDKLKVHRALLHKSSVRTQ